ILLTGAGTGRFQGAAFSIVCCQGSLCQGAMYRVYLPIFHHTFTYFFSPFLYTGIIVYLSILQLATFSIANAHPVMLQNLN
ncbi:hypothetical protein F4804DRAFT_328247, partial [Jackrogersella minutella]